MKCGHAKPSDYDDPLKRTVLCDFYYDDSARSCGCHCVFPSTSPATAIAGRDVVMECVEKLYRAGCGHVMDAGELEAIVAPYITRASRTPLPEKTSGSCPCLYTTPCQKDCTCIRPFMSHGCFRCASYGSQEQRRMKAEKLARLIDVAYVPAPLPEDEEEIREGGQNPSPAS